MKRPRRSYRDFVFEVDGVVYPYQPRIILWHASPSRNAFAISNIASPKHALLACAHAQRIHTIGNHIQTCEHPFVPHAFVETIYNPTCNNNDVNDVNETSLPPTLYRLGRRMWGTPHTWIHYSKKHCAIHSHRDNAIQAKPTPNLSSTHCSIQPIDLLVLGIARTNGTTYTKCRASNGSTITRYIYLLSGFHLFHRIR